MNAAQLLAKKRDGHVLSDTEIHFLVDGYTKGTIPDYQMAALLAFIFCKGMTSDETQALTRVMMDSGMTLTWSKDHFYVDKHSTGGIGDKISLILAPLVASCGLRVPMISGRGLGHTGGTLDKLESIPGFRTDLSAPRFQEVIDRVGCAIVSQTADICPADKKIYGLRDVTGTVPSLPLIVSSIMSKKLAEGVNGLVLDVKFGSGAFMKTVPEARELASAMVAVGNLMGRKMVALLTDMNEPLGRAVGNALEVEEAVAMLRGEPCDKELLDVTVALSAEMLVMAGAANNIEEASKRLREQLASGAALEKWNEMVRAQGGDPSAPLPVARHVTEVRAERTGVVQSADGERVGWAAIALGAGRRVASDKVDHAVGFTGLPKVGKRRRERWSVYTKQKNKVGDMVEKGHLLAKIHHNSDDVQHVVKEIMASFPISEEPVTRRGPMVLERIV
jgi:pyrimidine-nucleoside phosphorylase